MHRYLVSLRKHLYFHLYIIMYNIYERKARNTCHIYTEYDERIERLKTSRINRAVDLNSFNREQFLCFA